MDSLLAIGVGLVLRIVVDFTTDNDDKIGGVLVGLWEGIVLNHFVRRMPRSFDPYLGFGLRIFVDFLFTQSLSRLALVALWALVGMLLADVAPNVWRDSGLRHIYRQVHKDVRRVKRSVPRIRIKNDLPSVRLFSNSRTTSSEVSGSIRSDRAVPSRSAAASPAPTPGPSRRTGRSPPGTFPDVSGWSETNTDVSDLRTRVVVDLAPSPALIPLREHTTYERSDTTHAGPSQIRTTTTIQGTTVTITQSQNEPDDPSRHDPPVIPDDWVDVDHATAARSNEPAVPPEVEPEPTRKTQAGPSSPFQSRPASILVPPPAIDLLPDISDVEQVNKTSRPPEQIPLPESRAASVIGGVYDQPQPRSALRDTLRSRAGKATSEIGVDPAKSLTPTVETQSTKGQSTSRSWTPWTRSKLTQPINLYAPKPPPKETRGEPFSQGKPDVSSVAKGSESQVCTPAQVDPPPSILTQPGDAPPLLLAPEPEPAQQHEPPMSKHDQISSSSAGLGNRPEPPQGVVDKGDVARPSSTSLLDLPSPTRTPPPPFTEFAGVPDDLAAGEGPAEEDPLTQDEAPTKLTMEQKAAEEKRIAFLLTQVQELEVNRADLQKKLDKEDDPASSPANAIESDLEDAEKMLTSIKARIVKKKFSEPPLNPLIQEVLLANKSVTEVQFAVTSAAVNMLLARDDAGPMTVQAVINRQKSLRGRPKEARDAVMAFAKRHEFATRSESATPGIINITL